MSKDETQSDTITHESELGDYKIISKVPVIYGSNDIGTALKIVAIHKYLEHVAEKEGKDDAWVRSELESVIELARQLNQKETQNEGETTRETEHADV